MIKDVFILIGTLILSLLLFYIIFGDGARAQVWNATEPVFQNEFYSATQEDGEVPAEVHNKVFTDAVELVPN